MSIKENVLNDFFYVIIYDEMILLDDFILNDFISHL